MKILPIPIVFGDPFSTPTPTPTSTPMPTTVLTPTPTAALTPSLTPTGTLSPTVIPSPTISPTQTPTPLPTNTPTPHPTTTPTPTMNLSPTPTIIITPTLTVTPTAILTPTPIASPTPILTPAPTPNSTPDQIGNDISYPQCGKDLPTGALFGIVGVNGGKASTSNDCLAAELSWAKGTSGGTDQSKIQLYLNTGNPGDVKDQITTWPSNNFDSAGGSPTDPYGTCDGSNNSACAWQYGWNRAVDDVVSRFVPAANSAGISTDPSSYPWWLDVETANSWRDGDDGQAANVAALEGMVSYFKSRNITPGLYSISSMWNTIAGSLNASSSLNGLDSWLPGASDLSGAKSKCASSPLTSGGKVTLTQYSTDTF